MKKIISIFMIMFTIISLCSCSEKADLNNNISLEGSTSMEKLIGTLKESFTSKNKNIKISYNPTGSGSGINATIENRCDIGLSSRDLKDDEKEKLDYEIIAIDGIVVIVNNENKINNLSLKNIQDIFTGSITNWKEVGGDDLPIVLVGREAASGTRDGFESITNTKNKCKYAQELTSTGDVMQTVATNKNAIGYISFAQANNNIKMLSVDNIIPSMETIQNDVYKIKRNFIFVTKKGVELNKNVKLFYDYARSSEAEELIKKSGSIPVKK